VDLATVRLDALATDGESETEARSVVASLFKWPKQFRYLAWGQAAALVLDRDEDSILGRGGLQRDVAVGARELERVLQEVGNRPGEQLPVDQHVDPRVGGRDGER